MQKRIAVVGGGAAGLIAAGEAAQNGADVTLFEKNGRLGRKLVITGKGRCNLTNLCTISEFLPNVAVNPRFMYSALNYFSPEDTMQFFEELGVELKVERGRRVFPSSDKSFDIVDALRKFVNENKVKIINEKVVDIGVIIGDTGEKNIEGVETAKGKYFFDAVIICTGGMSYPSTGSDGDGYIFARKAGHNIIPLKPSLVPIEIKESFCPELMGLSLKNVSVSLYEDENGKKLFGDTGEMIFTHFGISGPIALSLSSHIRKDTSENRHTVVIDLKPALTHEQLDRRILSDFDKYKNKNFKNALNDLLPQKIIPVVIRLSEINPEKKINEVTKAERTKLVHLLKNFSMTVKHFRPFDEAIITSGGIDVKEIVPNKMESKLVKGLFFAGEIIDVDAYTGGYNLQIAFSTGKLAGKSASV